MIYLSISTSIRSLSGTMLALAGGTTDISIPAIKSNDELREMAQSLDVFRSNAEQLNEALNKERELNNQQRRFISLVSHEFRTPLAIIDGNAQRVARKIDQIKPDRLQRAMQTIRGSVARLLNLMESVLSSSRLDEGQIKFEPTACDVGKVIADVCNDYQQINDDRCFVTDVEHLPREIMADLTLLRQLFSNLVSNAIKYSPKGSPIHIEGRREHGELAITVRETLN